MTKLDTQADAHTLVVAYREAALGHGLGTESGDYRRANRHHDTVAALYRDLRRRGPEAQRELLPLLDDISPYVRAWAAAHALDFAPDRGEPVLQRLAVVSGVFRLTAEATLKEWRNGSLSFP